MVVTKKELMDRAIEMFCEKGYENVSIPMICQQFNVTKGSFYHHFESKYDILIQWSNSLFEDFELIIDEESSENCYTQLETFLLSWAEKLHSIGPDLLNECLIVSLKQKGNLIPIQDSNAIALIKKGQQRGEITSSHSAEMLAYLYSCMIVGLSTSWNNESSTEDILNYVRTAIERIFK